MKAVIPSKPLSDAMKTIVKALAPASASLPVLTHAILHADGSLPSGMRRRSTNIPFPLAVAMTRAVSYRSKT